MPNKTKAALPGRQCHYTKLVRGQNTTQIDQVNRRYFCSCAGGVLTQPLAEFGIVRKSGVTGIPVSVGYQALPYTLEYYESFVVQPFASIPRLSSSRRNNLLIHPDRLSSPSSFIAIESRSYRSGSSLNCTANRSFLLSLVDIVNLVCKITFQGDNVNQCHHVSKAKPGSAVTLTGPLTTTLSEVTIMADIQSTQTRTKFTFLFLATPDHTPECAPVVLRFDADTEASARGAFPGWTLVFAAKIRTQAPCRVAFFDYATRRGWEFDSAAVQEVRNV